MLCHVHGSGVTIFTIPLIFLLWLILCLHCVYMLNTFEFNQFTIKLNMNSAEVHCSFLPQAGCGPSDIGRYAAIDMHVIYSAYLLNSARCI